MTRSRNNKHEKRTLRKKNKRENKSKRRRSKKKTVAKNKKKRTQKKKKINLQIGGNVEPIMARLLHTLERDIIEYLPSTKVVDSLQSEKHYLEMVDYIKLQEIINNNENFKKSPKIRKLFDYDLYEINEKDMYFVYKDFKCENIFKDVDKYYIYILYFYLMECNITKNDKIQDGGATIEEKRDDSSDPVSDLSDPIPENKEEVDTDINTDEKKDEQVPEIEPPAVNEGEDVKVEGEDVKVEGEDVKVEGDDVKVEGDDVKVEGDDVNVEGDDVKFEGDDVKVEEADDGEG